MLRSILLAAAAPLAVAATVQQPLIELPSAADSTAIQYPKKPLVSSEQYQSDVSSKNLFRRAQKLFQIAEKSEHDYGHPTRVIGSPGMSAFPPSLIVWWRGSLV